ncbi:MAG TPA: extracellular solute-binding protein [Sphaerochaeta sp.]|nr:extracellular solute-binding protein [Sphaerochaeta sp.]
MKKVWIVFLVAILTMGAVFAQGAKEAEGSGRLILYTTVADAQYDITIDAFNKLYPDIKVYYTYGGAGECKARIKAESANPQADAMYGGLQYADLAEYGQYFESYVSKHDHAVQPGFENTTGKFSFHDSQIPCLVVNTELEKELGVKVTGWNSLLDPRLKGKVATADPTASSSAWNNLQCILTDFGGWDSDAAWDYIAKLMQNGLVVVSSSSTPAKAAFAGEYVVGLSYEPLVIQLLEGGSTGAHMVYWEEGTTSVGFASAIIKGAKNLDNAKLFMDFLQSQEGQQCYLDSGARPVTTYPMVGGSEYMVDLNTINVKIADTEALANNKAAISEKWNAYWAMYGNR